METIEKVNVKQLMKDDIKIMSEYQKFLKNQRKSVRIIGERKMDRFRAQWKHQVNREKLRLMYAAYGIVRGNLFSVTENHYAEAEHPLIEFSIQIEELISDYEEIS